MATSHNRLQSKVVTPLTLQDIWIAKKRMASFVKTIPLLHSERLSRESEACSCDVRKYSSSTSCYDTSKTTLADSLLGGIGADNQHTFTMVKNLCG